MEIRTLDLVPEPRRSILQALKAEGPNGISALAARMGITYEGVRQHLGQLQAEGWVERRLERGGGGPGRPRSVYLLTARGDHLFPKEYDDLAVTLIDTVAEEMGPEAVASVLQAVVSKKVETWTPALQGKPLEERLEALRGIYAQDDPYSQVETGNGGRPKLIERNCPYLEVAQRRPALCSVTVSVLRRLLGRPVVRTARFQRGDGRCVFEVLEAEGPETDQPAFAWEAEPEVSSESS